MRFGILSVVVLSMVLASAARAEDETSIRRDAHKEMRAGNFKNAYEQYERLCNDADTDPKQVGQDLQYAVNCLQSLKRTKEVDGLLDATVKVHKTNWRLLQQAAQIYSFLQPHGYMVAGSFERGRRRGGGRYYNVYERDRVRSLQLMRDAVKLITQDNSKPHERGQFYYQYANMFMTWRGYGRAWKLQVLTDLSALDRPDPRPIVIPI